MSDLARIRRTVADAAVGVCWRQWKQLGAAVSWESDDSSSVVDPEGLLLLSFSMERHERRLEDLWLWWASAGSRVTSVQRLLTLADRFPEASRQRISSFAAAAHEAGDKRWSRHVGEGPEIHRGRSLKGPEVPRLDGPAALLVRLRAGIGLGAKADMLAFLLSEPRGGRTVSEIAAATAYSKETIRLAANDLVLARFLSESSERPTRLRAPAEAWYQLLAVSHYDDGHRPLWRYWSDLFPLLAAIDVWSADPTEAGPYVRSSKARDLVDRHARGLELNEIRIEAPDALRGEEYLPAFGRAVETIADWILRHA